MGMTAVDTPTIEVQAAPVAIVRGGVAGGIDGVVDAATTGILKVSLRVPIAIANAAAGTVEVQFGRDHGHKAVGARECHRTGGGHRDIAAYRSGSGQIQCFRCGHIIGTGTTTVAVAEVSVCSASRKAHNSG